VAKKAKAPAEEDMENFNIPGPSGPTLTNGDEEMAAPEIYEVGNLTVALTSLGNEFGAGAANRMRRSDQLSGDSQAMWSIAMTTPTQFAALAYRTTVEAGSGRTRAETNNPVNTAAPQ
jgi:hypothetical protein